MKKLILSTALLGVTFSFAQKKEISAAVKAIESGDTATATAKIAEAEGILGGKTQLLEPSLLEQYYYAKGLSLFKAGKVLDGAAVLGKIGELGKSKIYTGKDGKTKVYFVGKEAADQSGIAGLKEETYAPSLTGKLAEVVNPALQSANKAAMDAYNAKNYAVAAPKFAEVYNLLKSVGQDNKQYLYYSAIMYAQAKDNTNAIKTYRELVDAGYTGVETKYLAKNKKTGEVENMDKSSWDLLKKTGGDYTDFKTETSPSVEEELYAQLLELLFVEKKYEDVIVYADKGLKKFPKNVNFTNQKGLAYYHSGKTEEFVSSLKETVAKNPNDKDAWYNLGVMTMKDAEREVEAEGYFKKVVEIDPQYANAWQNLTTLMIGDNKTTIETYQKLIKSGKIDQANKVMEEMRKKYTKVLPYAEKWYEVDSNNIDAVSRLRALYYFLKNEAKAKEFEAKEDAMKKK